MYRRSTAAPVQLWNISVQGCTGYLFHPIFQASRSTWAWFCIPGLSALAAAAGGGGGRGVAFGCEIKIW